MLYFNVCSPSESAITITFVYSWLAGLSVIIHVHTGILGSFRVLRAKRGSVTPTACNVQPRYSDVSVSVSEQIKVVLNSCTLAGFYVVRHKL